jgi:hypothetical protein
VFYPIVKPELLVGYLVDSLGVQIVDPDVVVLLNLQLYVFDSL